MRWQLLCLMIIAAVPLFSQEQPSFTKKIIKDEKGNVYWPLSLPVYVQLSSTSDAKDAVMLTSVGEENMKNFANPMKWDGTGIHYVRHIDKLNEKLLNREISFPVYVDGINPVTNLVLQGAAKFLSNKQFFGRGLNGELHATDDMSGVDGVYKSVNGSAYELTTSIFEFSQETEYLVKYFSVDKVGNAGQPLTKIFTVDLTAPITSYEVITDHLEGKILSPRTTLSMSSTDNLSGVKQIDYFFDANKPLLYAGKIALNTLKDGDHQLTYFSIDNVTNSELPKVYSFYMDTKAPEVTSAFDANYFISNSGRVYVAKATTIQLTATDNKAGVKEIYYNVNGGPEQLYSSVFMLPQKQGAYSVRFSGIDNVNNKGTLISNSQLSNIFLDDTPPALSHQISNPKIFTRDTLFITKDASISLSSTDAESGAAKLDFNFDNKPSANYSHPFQMTDEGKHIVSFSATDNVNNKASASFFFVVDNTAPEIFWHMSLDKIGVQKLNDKPGELPVYAAGTSLYLAATDKVVGTKAITYSFNGQSEKTYSQPVKITSKGIYSLVIKAVDYLGNENVSAKIEFIIQ